MAAMSHQALRCFAHAAHFMITDFEQRLDYNPQEPEKFTTKRWLKKGAIPSLDCVVSGPQVQAISARERRQVNIIMHNLFVCGILKLLHIPIHIPMNIQYSSRQKPDKYPLTLCSIVIFVAIN
jgi:hypothetical protein